MHPRRAGTHCVTLAGLELTRSSGPCHPSADLQLSAIAQLRSHLDVVWTIDVNFHALQYCVEVLFGERG